MAKKAKSDKPAGRLLIVDDEPNVARVLATTFKREGWQVTTCDSAADALNVLADGDVDVTITDLSMPEMTGIELLEAMRKRGMDLPVLVVTAYGTISSAVEAIKLGAFDYLCKPFDLDAVKAAVNRAHQQRRLQQENVYLRQELKERYQCGNMLGSGKWMLELSRMIEKAARSRATVLLLGESGTGKELAARALHFSSPRSNHRFVAVSCAALPSELLESELFGHEKGAFTGANWQRMGRFELADGGTLFLDEIGDISLATQTKLLRVLQEREFERVGGTKPVKVDVRIIAATNQDLPTLMEQGKFREDLYYRLRVIEIILPPLRERKQDVPLLAKHFLAKYTKRDRRKLQNLSEEAVAVLEAHDWPGNIRELENAIEYGVVMAEPDTEMLTTDLLPPNLVDAKQLDDSNQTPDQSLSGESSFNQAVAGFEQKLLLSALVEHNWNLTRAAEAIGMTFRSMRYNVKKYGLTRQDPEEVKKAA